ncbi:hypothetical protein GCM10023238_06600 [Streptomyces heliomycini]
MITADTTDDTETLLPRVERLHSVLGFDGVITSCDYYLPWWRGRPPGSGCRPAPEAVENACRKDATRRVLADAGVPGPRFAVHEEWAELARSAEGIGYPLVVKPVDLAPACTYGAVDDEEQLAAAVKALGRLPVNARAGSGGHPSCCSKSSWTVRR